nr:phage/plasmid primase, P4 family [uncultured Cohaesibacter sp.]
MNHHEETSIMTLGLAMDLIDRGFVVFPANPKTKRPLVKEWDKVASGALEDMSDWWKQFPKAMVAAPMGFASGLWVLDLDAKKDEETGEIIELDDLISAIEEEIGERLPDTMVAETPRGGRHYYFKMPADGREVRNRNPLMPNIDVRGEGGYVIVPPSLRADGTQYRWVLDVPPVEASEALLALVLGGRTGNEDEKPLSAQLTDQARQRGAFESSLAAEGERLRKYALSALDLECQSVARCSKGGRNKQLFVSAAALGSLVGAGVLSEASVHAMLQDAAYACGLVKDDGLKAAQKTIRSGLDKGSATPRDLSEIRAKAARYQGHTRRDSTSPHGGPDAPPPANPDDYEGGFDDGSAGGQAHEDGKISGGVSSQSSQGDDLAHANGGEAALPQKVAHCATLDQNDTGNAQRLIIHFGDEVMVVREHGVFRWVGTHWDLTGGEEQITIYAQKTAKLIELETEHIQMSRKEWAAIEAASGVQVTDDMSEEERKAASALIADASVAQKAFEARKNNRRKYAVSSGNNGKINGMIKQAEPHITVAPEELDADLEAFNCLNGTLLFRRVDDEDDPSDGPPRKRLQVEFVPHDRAMKISKCAPVTYDPKAKSQKLREFLDYFQPDLEIQRFLQVYFAYCLTGLTGEQKLAFFYGSGSNGKSTLTEAIAEMMGPYAGQLNPESVTGKHQARGDQATPDLADLVGQRMVRVEELPRGEGIKENLIKALTGGAPRRVRRLNEGFFDLIPRFKAIMSGNDKPFITGNDFGIWRRVVIVPWDVTIPDDKRRTFEEVMAEFAKERSGLLNWLLEGLAIYYAEGLRVPQRISEFTSDYRDEMDPLQSFADQCVTLEKPNEDGSPSCYITGADFYARYCDWQSQNPEKHKSTNAYFGRHICSKVLGLKKEKINKVITYLNITVEVPDRYQPPAPTSFDGG